MKSRDEDCAVYQNHTHERMVLVYYRDYQINVTPMTLIFNWFISAIAVMITAYILPGVTVETFVAALIVAVVLAVINTFIKPVLVVLTLPITIMTLGLFSIVINGGLILLAAYIVPGFAVHGFWWAVIFALVLSLVTGVLDMFKDGERE